MPSPSAARTDSAAPRPVADRSCSRRAHASHPGPLQSLISPRQYDKSTACCYDRWRRGLGAVASQLTRCFLFLCWKCWRTCAFNILLNGWCDTRPRSSSIAERPQVVLEALEERAHQSEAS